MHRGTLGDQAFAGGGLYDYALVAHDAACCWSKDASVQPEKGVQQHSACSCLPHVTTLL